MPVLLTTDVAKLNPATGTFDDTLAPPSVATNAAAAAASATAAAASATSAATSAATAGADPAAAASATSAAGSATAAAVSATSAATSATAAAASAAGAGGGATTAQITAAINNLPTVARSGSYTDLSNKPVIPATAADVGAIPISSSGASFGVAPLDIAGHLPPAFMATGAVIRVYCPGDVTVPRPTSRTDVYVDWYKTTAPSTAVGYAITGDSWTRWAG